VGASTGTVFALVLISIPFLTSTSSSLADEAKFRGDPWARHVIDDSSTGADGVRTTDVNGDGLLDITTGWEEGGLARVYLHPGYPSAGNPWPSVTVGSAPDSEDAVFADLDGDGAIDVVSSCEGVTRKILVQWAPAVPEDYLKPAVWQSVSLPAADGVTQWMYSMPLEIDGKNGIDLVCGGKNTNGQIAWFEAPADPRCLADWVRHPISAAGWIMSLIAADMDGDGDQDIVTSDRYGGLRGCRWLENPGPVPAQAGSWPNHFMGAVGREAMFMDLADLDQDGLTDAVAAVQDMEAVVWMRRLDATGLSWQEWVIPYPANMHWPKAAAVADINRDSRPDLVLTCSSATPPRSGAVWMSYTTTPFDPVWEPHEISGEAGAKFDRVEIFDFDGDGDLDVGTTEELSGLVVIWYENPGFITGVSNWLLY
jgi:hypothetical protein